MITSENYDDFVDICNTFERLLREQLTSRSIPAIIDYYCYGLTRAELRQKYGVSTTRSAWLYTRGPIVQGIVEKMRKELQHTGNRF